MRQELRRHRAGRALQLSKLRLDFLADKASQDGMDLPANDGLGVRTKERAVHALILVRVLEHRQTEPNDPFVGLAGRRGRGRLCGIQQALQLSESANKQFVLVAEVSVESRAAHIGAVENLLDGYRFIFFFENA